LAPPKQWDVHTQLLLPVQYVMQVLFGVRLQSVMQPSAVLVHAAQLHGSGVAVGTEVGRGVGVGLGVVVGRFVGRRVGPGELRTGGALPVIVGVPTPGWPGIAFGREGVAPCDGAEAVAVELPPETAADGPGVGPTTPANARTVAMAADAMPAPEPAMPPKPPKPNNRPSVGTWAIQAPYPMVRQRRPTEILRKARTIVGSNCVPAQRTSSCLADDTLICRL
jgi:hypothetical protein